MPINSKYLFVASMDVDPDKEALFNEVYDTEHIPNLLKVPGVRAVTRTQGEPFTRGRVTAPSTRSMGRTCWSARRGPRRSNWAAGPARSGPTPAIGGTRSIRSASSRQPCSRSQLRAPLMTERAFCGTSPAR